ncbi:MAG: ArnT family glycosyltransferase [Dehalococcoidia bacterium]
MLGEGIFGRPRARYLTQAAACAGLEYWPLFLAGAIVLALGLPMILFPFGPDQAIFAYIGHRILHGGFPYIDAWDQKPPLIYLLYALALKFPGTLMRSVRLFDFLVLGLTMAALFLVARRLWSRWAGSLAALLYGAAYVTEYGYWHTAQPDGYVGLPLALSLWLYYRFLGRPRPWAYVLAGILTGCAFQLRYFTVLVSLGLLLVEWQHGRQSQRHEWRQGAARLVWFAAGVLIVQAAAVAYLVAGHALGAYFAAELGFSRGYAGAGGSYSPNGFRWDLYLDAARGNTLLFLFSHLFITVPAVAGLAMNSSRADARRTWEVTLLLLLSYLGVLVQAKFFWYHWLAVLPFLALLAGKGLAAIADRLTRGRGRLDGLLRIAGVLALLVVLTPPLTTNAAAQWQDFVLYFAKPSSRHGFYNQFGPYGGGPYSYLADEEAGRYLQLHTQPGDQIYIFGYEALVYLLSGRESPSRFFYTFPVISAWSPPAWQSELMQDLAQKRPRYILIEANEGAPWITGLHEDTAQYAAHFAPLQGLLAERYTREKQIEDFTVYRLRN